MPVTALSEALRFSQSCWVLYRLAKSRWSWALFRGAQGWDKRQWTPAAVWEGSSQVSGYRIYKYVPEGTVESLFLELFRA